MRERKIQDTDQGKLLNTQADLLEMKNMVTEMSTSKERLMKWKTNQAHRGSELQTTGKRDRRVGTS